MEQLFAKICEQEKSFGAAPVIPALSFGYVYDVDNPNQHGTYPPILFTSNFAQAYDAYTGDPLFNVTGVPTGTQLLGPSGEQLKLILTNLGNATNPIMYLSQWNSSRLWENIANPWTAAVVNFQHFTTTPPLPASSPNPNSSNVCNCHTTSNRRCCR